MAIDYVTARERIIESRREAVTNSDRHGVPADPAIGSPAAAVSEYHLSNAVRRRRHGMAIEQKRATEAVQQVPELLVDRFVVGAVRLVETLFELARRDRAAPQITMLLGASWNDPKPAARPRRHTSLPRPFDHRRIDFVLGTVAIDRRPRGCRDDRAAATVQRPPHQPINVRIFKDGQGLPPRGGHLDQPVGIIAARVRH